MIRESPLATLDLSRRDRYLAFAFAASDLLIEVFPDGKICFAAGAFHARFGTGPEHFAGQHFRQLFHAPDRDVADVAFSVTIVRGRLPPLILRLNDRYASPVILSGLALPTSNGRVCFTLGRVPRSLEASGDVAQPRNFTRLLEERMRDTDGGALSLVDFTGWSESRSNMPAEVHRVMQAEITDVLARLGGPGAIAGEIADGRFGILSDAPSDLRTLAGELESVLRGHPDAAGVKVASAELALDRGALTSVQAARALRFALARFAEGGASATDEAGFRDGLTNFIGSAEARARAVRASIAAGRFRLAYQPVVHLHTRNVHHYEALLRPIFTLGHPVQTTQDFVTFAEAVGLSEELDWAVLQQAVATLGDAPNVSVAVNVSGLSMQSAAFRRRMLDLLEPTSGVGGRLLVELTETADIEDVASAAESVAGLRAASVSVCIDDFGAGSAAFRYLREFRVDFVKLDGVYVRGALHNAREHGFLLSMVELAHFVGAKVIAETIESEPHAKLMLEMGVEYGQGWLFGRPGVLPGPRHPAAGVALA